MNTIKRCTPEMIDRFSQIKYIADYVEEKREKLARWNEELGVDMSDPVNARHLTNVGTFRTYVKRYLENHPQVNQEMTLMVRHLEPTPHGLPIQIYCFCRDKIWANYEGIQADVFDHILSVVREFDLRLYQNPAGSDFRALSGYGAGTEPQ
jgi:miniconductance mechanosensitive channel